MSFPKWFLNSLKPPRFLNCEKGDIKNCRTYEMRKKIRKNKEKTGFANYTIKVIITAIIINNAT